MQISRNPFCCLKMLVITAATTCSVTSQSIFYYCHRTPETWQHFIEDVCLLTVLESNIPTRPTGEHFTHLQVTERRTREKGACRDRKRQKEQSFPQPAPGAVIHPDRASRTPGSCCQSIPAAPSPQPDTCQEVLPANNGHLGELSHHASLGGAKPSSNQNT